MGAASFDRIARLVSGASRRQVLETFGVSALVEIGLVSLRGAETVKAKGKHKGKGRGKNHGCAKNTRKSQAPCRNNAECCTRDTGAICGTSNGRGAKTCCSPEGEVCVNSNDCCVGFCCQFGSVCGVGDCVY